MTTPAPRPEGDPGVDPDRLSADVASALQAHEGSDTDGADIAAELQTLEALHQRLAAALSTIDRA